MNKAFIFFVISCTSVLMQASQVKIRKYDNNNDWHYVKKIINASKPSGLSFLSIAYETYKCEDLLNLYESYVAISNNDIVGIASYYGWCDFASIDIFCLASGYEEGSSEFLELLLKKINSATCVPKNIFINLDFENTKLVDVFKANGFESKGEKYNTQWFKLDNSSNINLISNLIKYIKSSFGLGLFCGLGIATLFVFARHAEDVLQKVGIKLD